MRDKVSRLQDYLEIRDSILEEARPYLDCGGECNHYINNVIQGIPDKFYVDMARKGNLSDNKLSKLRFLALHGYAQLRVFLNWLHTDEYARERFVEPPKSGQERGPNRLGELLAQNQDRIKKIGGTTRILNDFVMNWEPGLAECYELQRKEGSDRYYELLIERGVIAESEEE